MMLGRLNDRKKGVIFAVKAMEIIVKEIPDAFLYFISPDPRIKFLRGVIKDLNLTNNVKMISYEQAEQQKETPELKPLFEIARRNLARRNSNNAVTINMPEVDIKVDRETKIVTVQPEVKYESNDMIQEMMLLASFCFTRSISLGLTLTMFF